MNQLISVVLPIYNGEKYMRQSIDSILKQTYENWELLIIDDGSTDHTPEIAMEYVQKDSRIQYYRNPQNLRLPKTLNRGFSLAKGDYLTWTSDDNLYYPAALEKMKSALQEQKKEFVFASCDVIDGEGNIVEVIAVSQNSPKMIVGHNVVGACFLYSRKVYETIGDYDPKMTLVEDYDYWQRICMKYEPACISEKLYAYRWHDGALTSTMNQIQHIKTLKNVLLKNRPGFGKLCWESNFWYHQGLRRCNIMLKEANLTEEMTYCFLYVLYFLLRRVPVKIKRTIRSLK